MKIVTIAALMAAQLLIAGPAQAAGMLNEEPTMQQGGTPEAAQGGRSLTSTERMDLAAAGSSTRAEESGEPNVGGQEAPSPREDQPKKRKSTGDKLLTGAAVILGVGALAVGGLLVAIFAN